eukprot:4209914-Prymnesium_polylepis.1
MESTCHSCASETYSVARQGVAPPALWVRTPGPRGGRPTKRPYWRSRDGGGHCSERAVHTRPTRKGIRAPSAHAAPWGACGRRGRGASTSEFSNRSCSRSHHSGGRPRGGVQKPSPRQKSTTSEPAATHTACAMRADVSSQEGAHVVCACGCA